MSSQLKPAIWSRDTGQQLVLTVVNRSKDRCPISKMYAVNWHDTGHIGIHGRVDVWTDVRTYVRTYVYTDGR